MAIYCSKCGTKCEEKSAFCGSCGTALGAVGLQQDLDKTTATETRIEIPFAGRPFVYDGTTFSVKIERGIVLDSNKQLVTETFSSHSLPNSQGNRNISINSRTTERQEFWYRTASGSERLIKLFGKTASVRPGNDISTVWISHAGYDNEYEIMIIINHTAGEFQWVHGLEFYYALGVKNTSIPKLLIQLLIASGCTIVTFPILGQFALLVGPGYIAYKVMKWYRNCKAFDAAAFYHLDTLAEDALGSIAVSQ